MKLQFRSRTKQSARSRKHCQNRVASNVNEEQGEAIQHLNIDAERLTKPYASEGTTENYVNAESEVQA